MTHAAGAAAARRRTAQHILETVATAASGAALAAAVWTVVDLAVVAAVVGGANGAISGSRRIYRWRSPSGWAALALDSTWALATTAAAFVGHGAAVVQRAPRNYVGALSTRRNRHVYQRGYTLRRGFMLTIGNVVNGVGPTAYDNPRRRHAVERHEDIHIWQARWFGPLFPIVYAVWWVVGALAGVAVWAVRRPAEGFARTVDSFAYYRNPFEWWAYSREGRWPPPHAVARYVWPRPLVRKL